MLHVRATVMFAPDNVRTRSPMSPADTPLTKCMVHILVRLAILFIQIDIFYTTVSAVVSLPGSDQSCEQWAIQICTLPAFVINDFFDSDVPLLIFLLREFTFSVFLI